MVPGRGLGRGQAGEPEAVRADQGRAGLADESHRFFEGDAPVAARRAGHADTPDVHPAAQGAFTRADGVGQILRSEQCFRVNH